MSVLAAAPGTLSPDPAPVNPADHFGGGRPVVMQVIPSLVTGGAERGCVDIAAAVQRAGGRAIVVSSGGPMARELERYGARHVTLPVDSKSPLVIRRNAKRLAALAKAEGVDIIHARSRAPAWSCLWAAEALGIPFVTTFHAPYNFKNGLKRWYNSVMSRGDRVIAVSRYVYDHVAANYGVGPDRLRLVHRGVDVDLLTPEKVTQGRMAALVREWRIPEHQRIVMLPGRLTRWKGQGVLIEAISKLGRKDVRAVLVGGDQGRSDYRAELEGRIRALGLEGQVTIAGHCNDMAAAYMLADVVVSASTEPEAFGRIIVEAQAMGRPVIVTDLGAVRETVVAGETGLVVPPGDAGALADAIREVLDLDPLTRKAVGLDGMRHVRAHFTKEGMCAATLGIYAELLAARAPVARGRR
ncbi:glycosyltransferase family 4 protein [Aerophototrophica crusticola]|uniref:Glycosyltransferase family 4 protein n=1 Tax=Aerophototrophica crusticola TaxID=1709002 RepID=A0A858RBK5_9PROT|nr:glycosyltransferase family 4 protein [Rhodospirillaceae bacterium B3]